MECITFQQQQQPQQREQREQQQRHDLRYSISSGTNNRVTRKHNLCIWLILARKYKQYSKVAGWLVFGGDFCMLFVYCEPRRHFDPLSLVSPILRYYWYILQSAESQKDNVVGNLFIGVLQCWVGRSAHPHVSIWIRQLRYCLWSGIVCCRRCLGNLAHWIQSCRCCSQGSKNPK